MVVAHGNHTATLLQDGSVLLAGGSSGAGNAAELYLPAPIAPLSLTVTPAVVTMQPGDARGFTAVDHLGHPRLDAVWSVNNGSLATVDPATGIVTATTTGAVVLTAEIGAVSGVAQITIAPSGPLPAGTVRWSVPTLPGSISRKLVTTAGGAGGPAMVSVSASSNETLVQGLSADGLQQWQAWVTGQVRQVVPNHSGGVILTVSDGCSGAAPLQLISIDGPTGVWAWHAVAGPVCTPDEPQIAVRHDGAVAVVTPGNISGYPNLMLLDGATGAPMTVPAIPASTFTSVNGQLTQGYSRVGPPMIDVDGTVHLLYEQRFLAYPPQVVNTAIWLMSVHPSGSSATTQLATTTANVNLFPGRIIPDGAGGLIASWIDSPVVPAGQPPAQSTFRAARIPTGGGVVPFDLPLTPPLDLLHPPNTALPTNPELMLGVDDRAFVSYSNTVADFHVGTGASALSYSAGADITMLASTSDGSLVAKTASGSGIDTILHFAAAGGLTTSTFGVANIGHLVRSLWTSSTAGGGSAVIEGDDVRWAPGGWFQPTQGGTRRVTGEARGTLGYQVVARDIVNALRPRVQKIEWGGLVCQFGDLYKWSQFVPGSVGFVDPQADALAQASCAGGAVFADVHLHVLGAEGHPGPSGGDVANAWSHGSILYYLSARGSSGPGAVFYKYKGTTNPSPPPYATICQENGGQWQRYDFALGQWQACPLP